MRNKKFAYLTVLQLVSGEEGGGRAGNTSKAVEDSRDSRPRPFTWTHQFTVLPLPPTSVMHRDSWSAVTEAVGLQYQLYSFIIAQLAIPGPRASYDFLCSQKDVLKTFLL